MTTRTTLLTMIATCLMLWSCDTKTKTVDSCGDGFMDPGEECDGSQLTVTSCAEFGFYEQTGAIQCNSSCRLDLSVCGGGKCGDRTVQTAHEEDCDIDNLDDQTCVTLGFSQGSGTLSCTDACTFNETACVPRSANAHLATLMGSRVSLIPAFSAGTTSYSATVPTVVTGLTVTATAADPYASVSIAPAQPMTLSPGANAV
ncbi:cadherin-like beta sandwich domain-containing protein, partial [Myxococcota bacterium]|nr:cadherin-like beta sandwich domain-containing protein [Myxococcota bacterium]MBU1413203.1 cadherin-like beta sandwich domain-containing protein [Myxococcota bacterium]MBU1511311.1 cadherin-like beta sandwich domain-containing protein [Myxococcota bacterium]